LAGRGKMIVAHSCEYRPRSLPYGVYNIILKSTENLLIYKTIEIKQKEKEDLLYVNENN